MVFICCTLLVLCGSECHVLSVIIAFLLVLMRKMIEEDRRRDWTKDYKSTCIVVSTCNRKLWFNGDGYSIVVGAWCKSHFPLVHCGLYALVESIVQDVVWAACTKWWWSISGNCASWSNCIYGWVCVVCSVWQVVRNESQWVNFSPFCSFHLLWLWIGVVWSCCCGPHVVQCWGVWDVDQGRTNSTC